jgi:Zn-dependent peptidase ImmA (M78 family)
MKIDEKPRPMKEAARLTLMLDQVLGKDRFDRSPVNVKELALEYSAQTCPQEPIDRVVGDTLEGCMGALVPGEGTPRKWAIMHHLDQSPGRRNFTIGHELGHYLLHRSLIPPEGIYCDEESILRRNGEGIEKEADLFAASLLMPFHDFRLQLPAKTRPDFEVLMRLAERYGVSLTAAILRWLEYTETRAIMVVSNEGYAHWAKASDPAYKSGLYIKTKDVVFELPERSLAVRREFTEEAKTGVRQERGVWFDEPAVEMCIRSERYDLEITLLHFGTAERSFYAEAREEDTYERFVRTGQN